ncbi:hypothetical protein C8J57DRAFT_1526427 [Mycena rebaudengoi]|nr:hypothetical protein C8J57DRAFT_1526427 [Mycena rebaudengoi]
MAHVDPHLTFGCEVCLDTEADNLRKLTHVEHEFKGRPLLALGSLIYLLDLPPTHLAKIAYLDNPSPLAADMPCWLSDLHIVLASLPVPVTFPEGPTMSDDVAEIRKCVLTACQQHHSKITKELAPRDAVLLFDIIERLAKVFATCDALRPAKDVCIGINGMNYRSFHT